MKELFDKLLSQLQNVTDDQFTGFKEENGQYSFRFKGGKFLIVRSISVKNNIGYLTVYHETSFKGDKQLIELKDFVVTVNNYSYGADYRIKNFVNDSNSMYRPRPDEDGFIRLSDTDFDKSFVRQFTACLQNSDFIIYL